jgi:hypothetical protein
MLTVLGLVSESSSTFDAFYHYDGLGSVVGQLIPRASFSVYALRRLGAVRTYQPPGHSSARRTNSVSRARRSIRKRSSLLLEGEVLPIQAWEICEQRSVGWAPRSRRSTAQSLLVYCNNPIRNLDPDGLSFLVTYGIKLQQCWCSAVRCRYY